MLPVATSSRNNYVFSVGSFFTGDFVGLQYTGTVLSRNNFVTSKNGSYVQISSGSSPAVGEWQQNYVDWTLSTQRMSVNGAPFAVAGRATPLLAITGASLLVGSGNSETANLLLGPIAITNRPLTPRERSKLAAKSQWTWRDLDAA